MSMTVNAFPPLQEMNSPRGWVLAIIVLLHAVFFWLFASGLGSQMISAIRPTNTTFVNIPQPTIPEEPIQRDFKVDPLLERTIYVPTPVNPTIDNHEPNDRALQQTTDVLPPPTHGGGTAQIEAPVVEMPSIDSRTPLSEPDYPASEIRQGHTGTVMLAILVMENGRVGDVRVEQSSGFSKLDGAAAREAKRWRLKPGSQDGRPVAMWKTIPITFQLNK